MGADCAYAGRVLALSGGRLLHGQRHPQAAVPIRHFVVNLCAALSFFSLAAFSPNVFSFLDSTFYICTGKNPVQVFNNVSRQIK